MFEIGTSLREARLRQGLDLTEVEQATKVRSRYLRALEDEQFEGLPAPTYVKGFLRTYADYLGLDGQLYVDEFNSRYVAGEDEPPLRRSGVSPRYGRRVESRVVFLALGAIAVVTALVIAAWKYGGGSPQTTALPPATTKSKPHKTVKRPRPQSVPAATFTVTATGPSFVKVRLGARSGKQVFAGTMDPGQFHRFYAKRLWIAASDPTALRATLQGRTIALPNRVKRTGVIVTASGLRAG